jgi:hypothetical protein
MKSVSSTHVNDSEDDDATVVSVAEQLGQDNLLLNLARQSGGKVDRVEYGILGGAHMRLQNSCGDWLVFWSTIAECKPSQFFHDNAALFEWFFHREWYAYLSQIYDQSERWKVCAWITSELQHGYDNDFCESDTECCCKVPNDNVGSNVGRADECKICFEGEANCLLSPCNHLAVCNACAQQLDACPICRGAVKQRTTVFRA